MGIFLVAVIFVFQFMYGLFIPFQSGSDEVTLAADMASTVLVERLLRADNSGDLNVIDQSRLDSFNDKLSDSNSYNDALNEIGLFSSETVFDMNVSVTYVNGTAIKPSGGPTLPENTDIGQTRRLVLIVNSSTGYNQTAIVSVRVW